MKSKNCVHKFRIFLYADLSLKLKLWKLKSRNIRNKLKRTFFNSVALMKVYDKRIVSTGCKVRLTAENVEIPAEPIQKLVNYKITNNSDLDMFKSICFWGKLDLESQIRTTCFRNIDQIVIRKSNFDFYSRLRFTKIRELRFEGLSISNRVNYFGIRAQIKNLTFSSISFESATLIDIFSLQKVEFHNCSFSEKVRLPSIKQAFLMRNKSVKELDFRQLDELTLNQEGEESETCEWIGSLHRLKSIRIEGNVDSKNIYRFLPSSLRSITILGPMQTNDLNFRIKLPFLVEFNCKGATLNQKQIERTKLRVIDANIQPNYSKGVNPKDCLLIDKFNVEEVNRHYLSVYEYTTLKVVSDSFWFANIPDNVEKIVLKRWNHKSNLLK